MTRGNRIVRSLAVNLITAIIACAGAASPVMAQAVDDRFTFQGELRTPSGLATGSYDFRFRLYDNALGGLQVGAQQLATAPLVDGKFAVTLQFAGAFAGQNRYIEIDAAPAGSGAWITLTPRQLLSASPHASWAITAGSATNAGNSTTLGGQLPAFYTNANNMNAGTLPSARLSGAYSAALTLSNVANNYFGSGANLTGLNATNLGSGTVSDARLSANVALRNAVNTFTLDNSFTEVGIGTASPIYPLHIVDTGGIGAMVINDGSVSIPYGYYTQVNGASSKYGYYADVNGNVSGIGYGVYVSNETVSGRGYYASMTGTGSTYGVYVSNNSDAGYGGYFNNTSGTGTTYGLYTENNSPDGYGIFARHDAESGTGPAVYGETDSNTAGAYAIHGVLDDIAGGSAAAGVRGENRSTTSAGYGVYGSHAGTGWGVYGSAAVGGRGVFGDAFGEGYGVYGSTDDGYGVYGVCVPTNSTEACYGVRGVGGNSDNSYGVYGSVSGAGIGVYGYSTGGYGGYFDTGVASGPALYVVGTTSTGVITIRGGADLAENFEVATNPEEVTAGMVVMIDPDHEGKVKLATGAYNKCVAGVISGANELKAGMILGDFDGLKDGRPLALSGRVYTYVDATEQAVQPGDLLTTSDTPGYAMVATDASRSHGAVIGKAMGKLAKGEKGMVLVLVNLQ